MMLTQKQGDSLDFSTKKAIEMSIFSLGNLAYEYEILSNELKKYTSIANLKLKDKMNRLILKNFRKKIKTHEQTLNILFNYLFQEV